MNEISIVINDKELVVKKLPLRKYAELLASLQELPKNVQLIKGKSGDEILQNLPELISVCYPDVVRILHIITDMPEEEINELGLDDIVKIGEAYFLVNNYKDVYDRLKKVTAPRVETTQLNGSGGQSTS